MTDTKPMREAREVIANYLAIDVYGEGVLDFVDVFKDADAILTALSSAGIDCEGWRDIESAPKDGECILAYKPDEQREGPWMTAVYWCDHPESTGWIPVAGVHPLKPTHWRPLPLPPLASGGG